MNVNLKGTAVSFEKEEVKELLIALTQSIVIAQYIESERQTTQFEKSWKNNISSQRVKLEKILEEMNENELEYKIFNY